MTEAGHGGASPDVARVLWRHYVMITTLISIDFIHGHLFICLCLFIYLFTISLLTDFTDEGFGNLFKFCDCFF